MLAEERIVAEAEVALSVGGQPRVRIGVDALEDRRVVGQVEQARERIERARAAEQVVVALFAANLDAIFRRQIAEREVECVAEIEGVLRKDRRRRFGARRAETDAVE